MILLKWNIALKTKGETGASKDQRDPETSATELCPSETPCKCHHKFETRYIQVSFQPVCENRIETISIQSEVPQDDGAGVEH